MGQLSSILADSHGLAEDAAPQTTLGGVLVPDTSNVHLLLPPTPISRACTNWPQIAVRDDVFAAAVKGEDDVEETVDADQVWEDEEANNISNTSNGLDDDDLDLDNDDIGGDWAGDDDDDDLFGDDDDAFGGDLEMKTMVILNRR